MQPQGLLQLDPASLRSVACPLCGGRRFRELAASDRYDMGLRTAGCCACGLIMTNPQPSEDWLGRFYRDHYRAVYQRVEHPSLDYISRLQKDVRAIEASEFLDRHGALPQAGLVMDIGASEGCILKAIADRKPGITRIAVEPNPQFGAFARTHARCELYASVDVLPPTLAGRVDLIIMNHVYEHISDPVTFAGGLKKWLAPHGRLYIDVPDVERYRGLEALHIAHLYHFSRRTLAAAMHRAGFNPAILEVHTPAQHPPSVRVLSSPTPASAQALGYGSEGWQQVLAIDRRAYRFHRGRWTRRRQLDYRLAALRRRWLPAIQTTTAGP